MEATRDQNLLVAKISERSFRYENMMEYMEKVALATTVKEELTAEERNLLAVAYKNVVGGLRNSLGTILRAEHKQECRGSSNRLTAVRSFRERIEAEFSSTCRRVLDLIETTLLPNSGSNVSKIFYLKMKADYLRYLAEFKIGLDQNIVEKTLTSYLMAQEAARAEFQCTHPIRLGVALNFSVFYYKVLDCPPKAISIAKQAYDLAVQEMDALPDYSFQESAEIIERLRGNLSLWSADEDDWESDEVA